MVTGAAKRIGAGVCVHLAGMGYDIALHYRDSLEEARKTAMLVKEKGVRCELFRADISKPANARKLVERASRKFGGLSVLINNASVFKESKFGEITEPMLEDEMAINFKAPFFASQEFARQNLSGLIVNMIDSRLMKNHTTHFVYNISKKCLYSFTLAAAKDLGPRIRVNAICPGPILPAADAEEKTFRKIARQTPLGKIGDVAYINMAVEYLVKNSFVTGETLFVDGGQHL